MITNLTSQALAILVKKKKPIRLDKLYESQTVTKHYSRLGLLMRDLDQRHLINVVSVPNNINEGYLITKSGIEFYKNEVCNESKS